MKIFINKKGKSMKNYNLQMLPMVLLITVLGYLKRLENCRFSETSREFLYISRAPLLWNIYLLPQFHTQKWGEAKSHFFDQPDKREEILCDRIGKNYAFENFLAFLSKEKKIFEHTLERINKNEITPEENKVLIGIEAKWGMQNRLTATIKSYFLCGFLTIKDLPRLNTVFTNKLENPIIRHYIGNHDLTVDEVLPLSDEEIELIGDKAARRYVATRELSLPLVLGAGQCWYKKSSGNVKWLYQIYLNLQCDNVRMGIALGRFTALQAIYFDWEIRKFLNDLEITNFDRLDTKLLALIIKLSEEIRHNLESNAITEIKDSDTRLLLRLESNKILQDIEEECDGKQNNGESFRFFPSSQSASSSSSVDNLLSSLTLKE